MSSPQRRQCVKIQRVANEMIHVIPWVRVGVCAKGCDLPGGSVGLVVSPKVVGVTDVSSGEVEHIVVDEVHVPAGVGRTAHVDVLDEPRVLGDGVVGPRVGGVLRGEGGEVQRITVHDFDVIARVASTWRWLVRTQVCGHPRGARVIVRPQFCPVVVGVSPKEQLRTVLNGKQIAGETALAP